MPSITCRAPTHTTAAVPSAISTPTALEYDGLQRVQPPAGGQAPPARRHEAPLLVVLARERLDDPHRRHRPLDEGVHLAVAVARISGGAGDAASRAAR